MTGTRYGTLSADGFCPIHEWDVGECDLACQWLRPAFRQAIRALGEYWSDRECGIRPMRDSRERRLLIMQRGRMVLAEKRRKAA